MDYASYYFENEYKKLSEQLDAEKEDLDRIKAAERARAEIEKQKAKDEKILSEEKAKAEEQKNRHETYLNQAHKEVKSAGISAAVRAKIDKYKGAKQ